MNHLKFNYILLITVLIEAPPPLTASPKLISPVNFSSQTAENWIWIQREREGERKRDIL